MALTQEQQVIFDAVISSIKTNSKTIEQLTPQTSLGSDDWFELNGGRKVSYTVLRDLIASMSSSELNTLRTLINKNALKSVSFDVTENTATLTIKSGGTTISCNLPVATLDSTGRVPIGQLPSTLANALPFAGMVDGESPEDTLNRTQAILALKEGALSVVYDKAHSRFLLRIGEPVNSTPVYYTSWQSYTFGDVSVAPSADYTNGRLFLNTSNGENYIRKQNDSHELLTLGELTAMERKMYQGGVLTPVLSVEHKANSVKISIPVAKPDGSSSTTEGVIGAVGIKAGLMLPKHVDSIDKNADDIVDALHAMDDVNLGLMRVLGREPYSPQSIDALNKGYGTQVQNADDILTLDYPASAPEHVVWLDGPDEPLKSTDYSVEFEFQSSLALSDLSVMLFDKSMTSYKWDNNDPFIRSEVGAYSANEWHKVSIDMAKYIALTGWNQDKSGERLRINFNNIPASGEAVSISIKNIRVYHNQEVKAPEGTDLNTFAGKAELTSTLIKAIDEAADADSISFMEKINEQMRTILNGETVKPAPVKAKGAASLKNTHTLYKGMISIFAEKGIVYRNIGYIKFPFYNAADVERTFSVADIAPALLTDTSFASVDYDAANQTITIHRTANKGTFLAATIEVSKDWPYIMRGEDGIIRGYNEKSFAIADAPGLQPPSVAEIRKCLLDEIEYWYSDGELGAMHSPSLEFEQKKKKTPRRKIPSENTVSGFTGSNQFDGPVSSKNKWRRISHLRGCGVYRVRRRSLSGRVSPWVVFTVALQGELFDLI